MQELCTNITGAKQKLQVLKSTKKRTDKIRYGPWRNTGPEPKAWWSPRTYQGS